MSMTCTMPEFYTYSEPIARKEHKCCECSSPIRKGEKHFRCFGKWEGEQSTHRQHLACMEACMLIRDKFNAGDCFGFGCLMEEFSQLKFENWHPPPDKIKPAWKQLRSLMSQILRRERTGR